MSIIEVSNASVFTNYGTVFSNISLTIESGQCHALIGSDNEGKTSLLNAITGINRLSSGSIKVFDSESPTNRASHIKRIAYVPDELLCFEHMTGAQFIDMTMQLRHISDYIEEAERLIEHFDINPALQLTNMSDDMNKCTYIISALLSAPEVLILDEPFNFLTDTSTNKLKEWIMNYINEGGTVLIANDSFDAVSDICTFVSVMKDRTLSQSNLPIEKLVKFKLITAIKPKLKTIPPEFIVVDHNTRYCRMVYKDKDVKKLKLLLQELKCKDFTVEDVTLDDILYNTYDWLEDIL